jgi:hypothetical protein
MAKSKKEKECPPDKILNPKTKRCVKKTGSIGKQLLLKALPKAPSKENLTKKKVAKTVPKQVKKIKTCPPDKVLNPESKRCVKKTGALGKKLVAALIVPPKVHSKPPKVHSKPPRMHSKQEQIQSKQTKSKQKTLKKGSFEFTDNIYKPPKEPEIATHIPPSPDDATFRNFIVAAIPELNYITVSNMKTLTDTDKLHKYHTISGASPT